MLIYFMEWHILLGVFYGILCCILAVMLSTKKRKIPIYFEEIFTLKGVPILGMVPFVKSPLYRYLMILRITYGKLFKLRLGMRDIIVVNDFQMTKKLILDEKESSFNSWKSGLSKLEDKREMVSIYGLKVKQKEYVLKMLEQFLSKKSTLNEIVQTECKYLLDDLQSQGENCTDISTLFPLYSINIITELTMKKRFCKDDLKFKVYEQAIAIGTKNRDLISLLYLMFPQFEHSILASKTIFWLYSKLKIFEDLHNIFNDEISEHLKLLDSHNQAEDFISQCLKVENNILRKNEKAEHSLDKQLLIYAYAFITTGYKTISSILEWSLLFMSKYPEIQEKVHMEIIEVIGKDKMPTIEDSETLTYTRAVMDEILRLGSPTPLRNVYRSLKNTKVDGFDIPANNLILINSYACNTNPTVWPKPFDFNPQHFLRKSATDNSMKYSPREELVIFGLDKREFFGETLVKLQFFLFFTSILQKFHISFGDQISDSKYKEILQESDGIYRSPNIKKFIFKRHSHLI